MLIVVLIISHLIMTTILSNNDSYILGLLQTDGNRQDKILKRKSRLGEISTTLTIELSSRDEDILHKVAAYIGNGCAIYHRTRDTNFKKSYSSTTLSLTNKEYISKIISFLPAGKKSNIISKPDGIFFSEKDYWRGIIDGDGSLGIKKNGCPYISLITASEPLKNDYLFLIKNICQLDIVSHRNNRDNVFNMVVLGYHSLLLVKYLYYSECLSLDRKYNKMLEMMKWEPYGSTNDIFSAEEDKIIATHSLPDIRKIIVDKRFIDILNRKSYFEYQEKMKCL